MAISFLPAIGFTLTLPDTSTLVPVDDTAYGADAVAVPSNCRTIVILNLDDTNQVLVKFGQNRAVSAGSMSISNSTVVPVSSAMTFEVGFLGDRGELSETQDLNLFLLASTGSSVQVNITYLQGRGTALL